MASYGLFIRGISKLQRLTIVYLGKKEKEEEKLLEGKHNNNLTTASKQNLNKKLLSVTNHHHDYIIVQRPVKSIKMKLIGTGAYLKLQQL